jgi:Tol biopolymer transport system component
VNGTRGWDIYTVNAGGGGKFNVTNSRASEFYPDYSPDGKRIVFAGTDDVPPYDLEIYTISADGGG